MEYFDLHNEMELCNFAVVTILLAMSVYQIIISGKLPTSSDSVPVVG